MRLWPTALVLAGSLAGAPVAAAPPAVSVSALAPVEISDSTLERALEPAASDDVAARKAAAKGIAGLGPEVVPAIGRQLAVLRKTNTPSIAAVVKPLPSANLGDALLETKSDAPGYGPAVTTTVLVRALAQIGTTAAVRQLLRVAVDHGGALRPEVALQLKSLGDKAVPALLETRKDASSELRHWAYSTLEGMGKRVPADAVQTQDNAVLADVLRAFGAIHDMDAIPVILSFVNSDRLVVRHAAREAILQYGQDAVWKLREAYTNLTNQAPAEGLAASEIAKQLFAAYDRLRAQEVYGLLDEGLAKEKAGKLAEAITAFEKVLARQPLIDRRSEMAPAYFALAMSLEDEDPLRAASLFRQSERLWPESPRLPQIHAELAYLEGKDLVARGIADREPFERALRFDPTHERARSELSRMDAKLEERSERFRWIAAAAAVVIVGILGAILFAGRRRPARA